MEQQRHEIGSHKGQRKAEDLLEKRPMAHIHTILAAAHKENLYNCVMKKALPEVMTRLPAGQI
jgi:hypothetical protein